MKREVSRPNSPTLTLNNLCYDEVTPVSESGFGLLQNTYSGGRIGVAVNHFGGINRIQYWGTLPMHMGRTLFTGDPSSSYQKCFRAQLVVDGAPYNLEFSDTTHYPFGYKSFFRIPEKEVEVIHRLTVLDDALVFSIEVVSNPRNLPLQQRIEHHPSCFVGAPGRSKEDWQEGVIPSGWVMTATDVISDEKWKTLQSELNQLKEGVNLPQALHQGLKEGTAWVALLNARGLSMKNTLWGKKFFLGEAFRDGEQANVLLFASNREALISRSAELQKNAVSRVREMELNHHQQLSTAMQFDTGDKVFDSMLANVPPTQASLRVEDLGTFRAASVNYWVWGWDTLTLADVHLLSGQADFALDILRFYHDTADAQWGVGHQFTMDQPPRIRIPMAFSAQLIYVIFLHQYGIHTGDWAQWSQFYPFIKRIFESNIPKINDRGMGEGPALWPDEPQVCGHTGNDISLFNNSIQYQGLRCFEVIAMKVGDQEMADKARKICRLMEQNFVPTFWDKAKNYFVDSVDSKTGKQRPSYPSHGFLWMTPFLSDLVGPDKLRQCAAFIAENHASLRGFLPYPRWDASFDADGNQVGQVWPQQDMFVTRCQAIADRQDVLEGWINSSDWFWRQLTYMEGYSAQTVNDSGTPDCAGGKMNFFGTKTTYMAFLTGCAGIHFDEGGITLSEGLARPLKIAQLPFRKAAIELSLQGNGKFAHQLLVNGTPVVGSLKIPIQLLQGQVKIVYERTPDAPSHPVILSLFGAEIQSVEVDSQGVLRSLVQGNAPAWLRYYSSQPEAILRNGLEIAGEYDAASREGKVLIPLDSEPVTIQIGGAGQ